MGARTKRERLLNHQRVRVWIGVVGSMIVCSFVLNGSRIARADIEVPPYTITSIKAYLYFNQKDALSRDISDATKGSLWNTIIGEGLAGSPSSVTLVVVEITGKPDAYEPKRKVDVTVREIGKRVVTKLQKQSPIGGLSKEGKYFAALLVYDTGCLPLEVSAKLLGQADQTPKTKRINFECGE